MVPTPDGIAFFVAQDKSVSALDYFAGEDEAASPCLTFEPVKAISSPLLKLTPRSSRKDLGPR
jgi:hypothetical protein